MYILTVVIAVLNNMKNTVFEKIQDCLKNSQQEMEGLSNERRRMISSFRIFRAKRQYGTGWSYGRCLV
jgi:hypothetical protein